MNLLLDLGNSRLKWAVSDGERILDRGAVPAADLAETVTAGIASGVRALRAVWFASVAGADRDAEVVIALRARWQCPVHQVHSSAVTRGVRNAYTEPGRLGVDRWLTLIAAHARGWAPCCIVDCGTAITLDGLAADGRHLGGVILPGVRLMREALYRHTRRIPADTDGNAGIFGTSTRDAVRGGTLLGAAAAVDALAAAQIRELGAGAQILLTGGGAAELRPWLQHHYQEEPDLVLLGLQTLAEG